MISAPRILATRFQPGPTQYTEAPSVALVVVPSSTCLSCHVDDVRWRGALGELGIDTTWIPTLSTPSDVPSQLLAMASLSLWLQRLAGHSVGQIWIHAYWNDGCWELVLAPEDMQTALWAGELASEGCALGRGVDADTLRRGIAEFRHFAAARCLDPNTSLIKEAALQRGLPWINLDQPPFEQQPGRTPCNGLSQVGQGRRRRVMLASLSAQLSQESVRRLHDRGLIRAELSAAGVPVPRGDPENSHLNRSSRAVRAAERIGYPVLMRPGQWPPMETAYVPRPVLGPLRDAREVELAYQALAAVGRVQSVEAFVAGDRQRWVVVGGRVVAAARCVPAHVVGDGVSTVASLVLAEAGWRGVGPARRAWERYRQGDPHMDLCLRLQGLDRSSVPAKGARVDLDSQAAMSQGGMFYDTGDRREPSHERVVIQAAQAFDLGDFCAVELVVTGGRAGEVTVLDVIAGPDICGHHFPEAGLARDVAGALLDQWFPDPESARVPILAVTGTNGKTTTAAMLFAILQAGGITPALSTTVGVRLCGEWLLEGDSAGVPGAFMAMADSRTDAIVAEAARGGLIKAGMPFDRCHVAACLNLERDHIGIDGVHTLDDMAEVKGRVLARATRAVVVNADDPRCLRMASRHSAAESILVSMDASNPAVAEHVESGRMAVVLATVDDEEWIVQCRGPVAVPVVSIRALPASWQGRLRVAVSNAMHAAAMALGMGYPTEQVSRGLRAFSQDAEVLPCRMNLVTCFPFKVLLDYAHNPHSLGVLAQAARQLDVAGRRILAFGIPDDRPDEALADAAMAVAGHYDYYFCKGILDSRAADPERAPRLLGEVLRARGVPVERIRVIRDPFECNRAAAAIALPGDLLVITSGAKTCARVIPLIEEVLAGRSNIYSHQSDARRDVP